LKHYNKGTGRRGSAWHLPLSRFFIFFGRGEGEHSKLEKKKNDAKYYTKFKHILKLSFCCRYCMVISKYGLKWHKCKFVIKLSDCSPLEIWPLLFGNYPGSTYAQPCP
jgi:hypothetical protein